MGEEFNVAVQGCFHGCADEVFGTVEYIMKNKNINIDLLVICGDFQAIRNEHDMHNMACPKKYLEIGSFYKYYTGEKAVPCLTLIIGGNHEASNHFRELYFGGWVAPNIYYLGQSGIVNVRKGNLNLRVGGISGIFKVHSFNSSINCLNEEFPFEEHNIRSVYHTKQLDYMKLMMYSEQQLDIFLSHDWPAGIEQFGNTKQLIQRKQHFKREIEADILGSRPLRDLLEHLQPRYWFAAHLHVKFEAIFQHKTTNAETKFLALDKCIQGRDWLQVMKIPAKRVGEETQFNQGQIELHYDKEWMSIVQCTYKLLTIWDQMPRFYYFDHQNKKYNLKNKEKFDELMNDKEQRALKLEGVELKVPNNFIQTVQPHHPKMILKMKELTKPQNVPINNQTKEFLQIFAEHALELNKFIYFDPDQPKFIPEDRKERVQQQIIEGEVQKQEIEQKQPEQGGNSPIDQKITIEEFPFL